MVRKSRGAVARAAAGAFLLVATAWAADGGVRAGAADPARVRGGADCATMVQATCDTSPSGGVCGDQGCDLNPQGQPVCPATAGQINVVTNYTCKVDSTLKSGYTGCGAAVQQTCATQYKCADATCTKVGGVWKCQTPGTGTSIGKSMISQPQGGASECQKRPQG